MSAYWIALTAVWPVLLVLAGMVAVGLWLDRRWAVRFTREELARQASTEALRESCRQRHAAQAPRRRGQDLPDPDGRSVYPRPVYDAQRAVEAQMRGESS